MLLLCATTSGHCVNIDCDASRCDRHATLAGLVDSTCKRTKCSRSHPAHNGDREAHCALVTGLQLASAYKDGAHTGLNAQDMCALRAWHLRHKDLGHGFSNLGCRSCFGRRWVTYTEQLLGHFLVRESPTVMTAAIGAA